MSDTPAANKPETSRSCKKRGKKVPIDQFFSWETSSPASSSPARSTVPVEERADKEIPEHPPYNVFIGNLSFEASEDQVQAYFGDLAVKSVRLVTDHESGRRKGFGFVEFADADSLRAALRRNGQNFMGRSIRIGVSEQRERPFKRPSTERSPSRSAAGGGSPSDTFSSPVEVIERSPQPRTPGGSPARAPLTSPSKDRVLPIYRLAILTEETPSLLDEAWELHVEQAELYRWTELPVLLLLRQFLSSDAVECDFPPELTSHARAVTHQLAEQLGLAHFSLTVATDYGTTARILHLRRQQNEISRSIGLNKAWDLWSLTCYLSLIGERVELAAGAFLHQVPESYQLNQRSRDGNCHHITVISQLTYEQMESDGVKRDSLLESFSKEVPSDWSVVGLGKACDGDGNEAMFVVVDWESCNRMLAQYHQPQATFHITLGFSKADVHGVRKDRSTLVETVSL